MSGEIARDAVGDYQYGFHDPENATIRFDKGLSEQVVIDISELKNEPKWMTDIRVKAYRRFMEMPMPTWGNCDMLNQIDFDAVTYFLRSSDKTEKDWDEVPEDIKNTFDRLGIPEAEQKWLGGVTAQYESEAVYHSIREDLEEQGVLFLDMDSGLKEYPEIVKKYFGTVIPASDNKFSALNTAVWSGGSFIYVPKGVHVEMPVQAYFRINAKNMGQFERTLIIADEGSSIHYVEGCTAPTYSTESLHSAVVEFIAMKGAKIRYSTVQNWSANVYNLVTKRGVAHADATISGLINIGSKLTMKYPAVPLKEKELTLKLSLWLTQVRVNIKMQVQRFTTWLQIPHQTFFQSQFQRMAEGHPTEECYKSHQRPTVAVQKLSVTH
ncbi:MAG: hypothetical protein CM15mP9_1380 [Methanobacteriota archaeon]|nr:MAG: hypothetical protein CM15mP9_1380 [Euryarchaeota archaeon]